MIQAHNNQYIMMSDHKNANNMKFH